MPKTYSIVGQKHRNLDSYLVGVLPGTPVVLVREPLNPFDKNAIAVWIGGQKAGYIPMKQNAALAAFIDQPGGESAPIDGMALDQAMTGPEVKAIMGTFVRSPNSAYPMVEV